jgi:hypothetical protein
MTTTSILGPSRRRAPRAALALLVGASLAGCAGAPAPEAAAPAPHALDAERAAPAAQAEPVAGDAAPARQTSAPAPAPAAAAGAASPARAPAPAASAPGAAPAPAGVGRTTDDRAVAPAPLIVYQGELALRVDAGTASAAIDDVVTVAESVGGHLAGRDDGRVVVKVPSARFREAMTVIDGRYEVERRNVKADDVTAEFKDLEVRLENLRATRRRLEQLLEKTGTLADTLTVEKELERVASEIDRIQGRLRFLRTHTAFSTLTVAVAERPRPAPAVVASAPPRPPRRELAVPLPWIERLGVDALMDIPVDD